MWDNDRDALESRVHRHLARLNCEASIDVFTYWYTNRPPVHEATIRIG
jgi:hypothetical protein